MIIDSPFADDYIYPRRLKKMCEYLVSLGNEVIVYCKKEADLKRYEIINGVIIKRVFDKFLGSTERIDFYLKSHIELFNNIDKNIEVYHCIDTMTLPIGILLRDTFGGKVVFDCFEYFPDYIEEKWHGDNKKKYELTKTLLNARGAFIDKVDYVIAVSEEMADRLMLDFSLNKKPIVVYNSDI